MAELDVHGASLAGAGAILPSARYGIIVLPVRAPRKGMTGNQN